MAGRDEMCSSSSSRDGEAWAVPSQVTGCLLGCGDDALGSSGSAPVALLSQSLIELLPPHLGLELLGFKINAVTVVLSGIEPYLACRQQGSSLPALQGVTAGRCLCPSTLLHTHLKQCGSLPSTLSYSFPLAFC